MAQVDEGPGTENFGFKRLGPDNWLHVDPAWAGVFVSASHPDPATGWVKDLADVQIAGDVPLAVRKLFEVARGALAYAIMFYPLMTLAIDQMTRVMDAAAREKCKVLGAPPGALKNFKCSIDWLKSNGILTAEDEAQWRVAVQLRNDASHPADQSIYGPGMALRLLDWSVEMINSLFSTVDRNPPADAESPMTKLQGVVQRIQAVGAVISNDQLSGARSVPEASAVPTQCFNNAQRKVQEAGGAVLAGWMFHYRQVAALPGPGYIVAVNHAVWHAPDNALIDVTPFHSDPKHHPIVVNGDAVLFLIDSNAMPICTENAGLALPSWYFPLNGDDEAMVAHVADLAARELDDWERSVGGIEGLKDSPWVASLIHARRDLAASIHAVGRP